MFHYLPVIQGVSKRSKSDRRTSDTNSHLRMSVSSLEAMDRVKDDSGSHSNASPESSHSSSFRSSKDDKAEQRGIHTQTHARKHVWLKASPTTKVRDPTIIWKPWRQSRNDVRFCLVITELTTPTNYMQLVCKQKPGDALLFISCNHLAYLAENPVFFLPWSAAE